MDIALATFALVPGLALGSFMNVVAARVPLRRSLMSPGSACMTCEQEIGWRVQTDGREIVGQFPPDDEHRDCDAGDDHSGGDEPEGTVSRGRGPPGPRRAERGAERRRDAELCAP